MELEISEMIDLIESHFGNAWGGNKVLTVGGIVGTNIFKHVMHVCLKYHNFHKILVIDGCQDYVGLPVKPIRNYIYYLNLFESIEIPSPEKLSHPFYKFLLEPTPGYQIIILPQLLYNYEAVVINNAHLIPENYLNAITSQFSGRIVCIVDPLDMYGERYADVPVIYDSLTKQSALHALARSLYHLDSRAIDRKVNSDFKKIKMSHRSIGKIDTMQYVTNSNKILEEIQMKQMQSLPRRNQKFIVLNPDIQRYTDQQGLSIPIGNGTMLSIASITRPLMKVRIHSSISTIHAMLSYLNKRTGLHVKPANIISIEDMCRHRFHTTCIVLGEEPMTNRSWYSIMKNSNIVNIVDY